MQALPSLGYSYGIYPDMVACIPLTLWQAAVITLLKIHCNPHYFSSP